MMMTMPMMVMCNSIVVRLGATVDDDRRRSATSAVNFRRC
jgi:hypothetical protein